MPLRIDGPRRCRDENLPIIGCIALLAAFVARPAFGQTLEPKPGPPEPEAAAPSASPAVPPTSQPSDPAAASPPAAANASPETPPAEPSGESAGPGLFEQSSAESGSSSGPDGASQTSGLTLNGYVRGAAYVGRAEGSSWENKATYGELALQLRTPRETFGDAFAEARFQYGMAGGAKAVDAQLREAYVNAYVGPFDFRFGHQIIVWGRADAFNPTNNLTPLDLRVRSPIEDDRRLANLGLRTFLNLAPVRIEAVWLPLYRATQVPTVVAPSYVDFNYTNYPAKSLENGTEAIRAHLELAGFEASVSYTYGYAPLPGLALNGISEGTQVGGTVLAEPRPIRIERHAYNQHVVGLDFSTALGDALGVRGEAALRVPLKYEDRVYAPRPDLQYVLGLDHSFGSVSVVAQYMGRLVLDFHRERSPDVTEDPAALGAGVPAAAIADSIPLIEQELRVRNQMLFSQLHKVQHLATARVEWLTLHDRLSLSALGFMNFSTKEWLLVPKLTDKLSDNLSASLGAEIFAGPAGTLFGLVDRQLSAGFVELRYAY